MSSNMQKFLFWQPATVRDARQMPVTLENLNHGCGFSGTDAAMLEVAGSLARQGHDVCVMAGGPSSLAASDRIEYMCDTQTGDMDLKLSAIDVLVISFVHPHSHEELSRVFKRLTRPHLRVLFWLHCMFPGTIIDYVERLTESVGGQLTLIAVSEFVYQHIMRRRRAGTRCGVVMNGINPAVFHEAQDVRDPLSFVFSASYERGGRIAELVHNRLAQVLPTELGPVGEMRVCSYCDPTIASLSKQALASMLRRSDYMVYPLVLSGGSVHHDTFACVVLEAMASGVLVVTWDVACFRGVYGDLITLVPPPPHAGYDPTSELGGCNHSMTNLTAVDVLVDAVAQLVAMPARERECRREKAREWALAQTWDRRAASVLDILEQMKGEK